MSLHMYRIDFTVQVSLTAYGDALFYGVKDDGQLVPALALKHRLFAGHAESFYGTELPSHQVQQMELVLLPAEQVLPYFADPKLLQHINWSWGETGAKLLRLAPRLMAAVRDKRYVPSLTAYRQGSLSWTWEQPLSGLEEEIQGQAEDNVEADTKVETETGADAEGNNPAEFAGQLEAAFSAVVTRRYYPTPQDMAELRREYPALAHPDARSAEGLTAKEWLVAIGWVPDTAPFRPALQILEPGEHREDWQLRLVLQDKSETRSPVWVRLRADGTATGSWPGDWSAQIAERSPGWRDRLMAVLPAERLAGSAANLLGKPLDNEEAWQFLTVDSERLLLAGWPVLLPAWWEAAARSKPKLKARIAGETGGRGGPSLFGLDSLVDFDWRIAIGDTELSEEEFAALAARNERLVRIRGQWVALDSKLLQQIQNVMAGMDRDAGLSFQDVLQLHLLGEAGDAEEEMNAEEQEAAAALPFEVELNASLLTLMSQLRRQTDWPKPPLPSGLNAELRAYQYDGFAWLAFLHRFGLGACLADDMGLGKTVQFIAYLLHVKETRPEGTAPLPSLIICPTSVLGNWQKELSRFAPGLRVMLHYGSNRLSGEAFAEAAGAHDVILTSYATATLDQELLQAARFASLCLDEAQNIKNAQTRQASVVKRLTARHRIALTGTPIENRLAELWSIYDFITPGYLGTARGFQQRFTQAIEREHNQARTADLQKLIKPFLLRRKKRDEAIQLDLPEKNEMKTYVNLTTEQGALYEQIVNDLLKQADKLSGMERKGTILAALTKLKQLCDHPLLMTKEPLPEISELGDPAPDQPDLTVQEVLVSRSAKLERLLAMVGELRAEGERCLIFTQYIGMGEMLKQTLAHELQEPVLYLNGSTAKSARDRMIEQFQAGEGAGVFILSLKAGGIGLNLTAANHVFHYDRWWNPAVENQATDRAYRIGQTRDVQVHKFIALGTLEERIDEMLENKQQLSDSVITSSEGWITELSTDALKDLFALRSS